MESRPPPIERRVRPAWVRRVALIIGYGLWPLVKLLEWLGVWAWLLSKGMKKFRAQFGDYQPVGSDVLVCSGFKSGTNWTMQIAVQITHRGSAEFEHIHDVVAWPDIPGRVRFAIDVNDELPQKSSPTGLRIIKTHLMLGEVPYTEAARYICVVRDPKDVFVSSYYFIGSLAGPLMPSLKTWLQVSLSPEAVVGGWADHLNSYWQMRDRDNVLFLTYEEMKADLPAAVDKIAAFMGVSLAPEERAAVIERSSFGHMKSVGFKFDPIGIGPPWAAPRGAMVRRGQAGTSGELLSAADRRRIDDIWRNELERLGSDFPYREAYGSRDET